MPTHGRLGRRRFALPIALRMRLECARRARRKDLGCGHVSSAGPRDGPLEPRPVLLELSRRRDACSPSYSIASRRSGSRQGPTRPNHRPTPSRISGLRERLGQAGLRRWPHAAATQVAFLRSSEASSIPVGARSSSSPRGTRHDPSFAVLHISICGRGSRGSSRQGSWTQRDHRLRPGSARSNSVATLDERACRESCAGPAVIWSIRSVLVFVTRSTRAPTPCAFCGDVDVTLDGTARTEGSGDSSTSAATVRRRLKRSPGR